MPEASNDLIGGEPIKVRELLAEGTGTAHAVIVEIDPNAERAGSVYDGRSRRFRRLAGVRRTRFRLVRVRTGGRSSASDSAGTADAGERHRSRGIRRSSPRKPEPPRRSAGRASTRSTLRKVQRRLRSSTSSWADLLVRTWVNMLVPLILQSAPRYDGPTRSRPLLMMWVETIRATRRPESQVEKNLQEFAVAPSVDGRFLQSVSGPGRARRGSARRRDRGTRHQCATRDPRRRRLPRNAPGARRRSSAPRRRGRRGTASRR